jgi:hypothetical protein
MLTVSAIAMAPSVLLRIALGARLNDPTVVMSNPGLLVGPIALSTFSIAIADAVLVVAASDGYLAGDVDLARALAHGAKHIFAVIFSVIIRWSIVLVPVVFIGVAAAIMAQGLGKSQSAALAGLLLLLFPFAFWFMIYAGLRTFAVIPAVLLEGSGVFASISRSWRLSKGCVWHTFFSLGLAWTLYFVIVLIATVIGQMLLSPTMVGVLNSILIIPIYPLLAIVSTLLYYDLRIRKEGFDLELMSRDLGAATAPLPAA